MFCTKCGAKLEEGAKSCSSCGAVFEEENRQVDDEENKSTVQPPKFDKDNIESNQNEEEIPTLNASDLQSDDESKDEIVDTNQTKDESVPPMFNTQNLDSENQSVPPVFKPEDSKSKKSSPINVKLKKNQIIGIVAGFVVLICAIGTGIWFLNRPKSVSVFDEETIQEVSDFISDDLKGVDKQAYFDLGESYLNTSITGLAQAQVIRALDSQDSASNMTQFLYSIDCSISGVESGSIKNDDEIKVACSYDSSYAKKAKVSLKDTEFTYTVSGLKETEMLDLFKDIRVEWKKHTSTYGSYSYYELEVINDSTNSILQGFDYEVYDSGNGMAKVYVYVDDEDLNSLGYSVDLSDDSVSHSGNQYTKTYMVGKEPDEEDDTISNSSSEVIGSVYIKVSGLNIRSSASTSSDKKGKVQKGDTKDVYETKTAEGYTWYRIGTNQWIADDGTWVTYTVN